MGGNDSSSRLFRPQAKPTCVRVVAVHRTFGSSTGK